MNESVDIHILLGIGLARFEKITYQNDTLLWKKVYHFYIMDT